VPLHKAVLAEALRLRSGKSEIADVSSGEVLALAGFGFAVDGNGNGDRHCWGLVGTYEVLTLSGMAGIHESKDEIRSEHSYSAVRRGWSLLSAGSSGTTRRASEKRGAAERGRDRGEMRQRQRRKSGFCQALDADH
jgi:hypothetical protein